MVHVTVKKGFDHCSGLRERDAGGDDGALLRCF